METIKAIRDQAIFDANIREIFCLGGKCHRYLLLERVRVQWWKGEQYERGSI